MACLRSGFRSHFSNQLVILCIVTPTTKAFHEGRSDAGNSQTIKGSSCPGLGEYIVAQIGVILSKSRHSYDGQTASKVRSSPGAAW